MKSFDALAPKYCFSTFVPGIVLAFDIIMVYDLFTIHAMTPFIVNTPAYWLFFAVLALIMGPSLSFIVYMNIKTPVAKGIVAWFVRVSAMKKKKEPEEAFFVLAMFFANLVLPTILFGFIFPDYLNLHFLQPFFCFKLTGAAFLFAVLTVFALALMEYE